MKNEHLLSDEEKGVILKLAEAYEAFLDLPDMVYYQEFRQHIEGAQRIVMSRAVMVDRQETVVRCDE